jgi:uncharacterized protein (DUF433 family)
MKDRGRSAGPSSRTSRTTSVCRVPRFVRGLSADSILPNLATRNSTRLLKSLTRQGTLLLKRIKWDHSGIPVRLFPFTRDRYTESPEIVSIDPKIRFGKPCLSGTRIPTAIISERHQAGDSIDLLAKDYGRNAKEIEEAIRYEGRIAS